MLCFPIERNRGGPNHAQGSPDHSKDQVPAKDHAVFDSIVASRGAVQGRSRCYCIRRNRRAVGHLGAYVRSRVARHRVRVLAAMTAAREFEAVLSGARRRGGARRQDVPETTITAIRENHSRASREGRADHRVHRALLRKHRADDAMFKAMQAASAKTS